MSPTNICYFGDFDPNYARNRVIIKGLQQNGVSILLCNDRSKNVLKYFRMVKKYLSVRNRCDIVIVGYSDSRSMVPLIKLISRKKIIWDAFYSLYDSWVFDRNLVRPGSLKAGYYWFLDWFSCKLADMVLLDTNAQIDYFSKTFGIKSLKFIKILVGTDDNIFYPKIVRKTTDNFLVHFHGNFIPLQGIEYIIRAASLLGNHNVQFQIIGRGQEYERIKTIAAELNLKSIIWINRISYEELSDYMSKADICLGIFGKTGKAGHVIPNKAYEAIAVSKSLISGDTPAMRELFTDRKDILFCKLADPRDLADKILELKNNDKLRNEIAGNGYKLFRKTAIPSKAVLPLINFLGLIF